MDVDLNGQVFEQTKHCPNHIENTHNYPLWNYHGDLGRGIL